jgi:hypothetical protein
MPWVQSYRTMVRCSISWISMSVPIPYCFLPQYNPMVVILVPDLWIDLLYFFLHSTTHLFQLWHGQQALSCPGCRY